MLCGELPLMATILKTSPSPSVVASLTCLWLLFDGLDGWQVTSGEDVGQDTAGNYGN